MKIGFLDLQTTGRHSNSGKIVQAAWRSESSHWDSYVSIEDEYRNAASLKLLNLVSADLDGAPNWIEIKSRLVEEFEQVDVVFIYYARFECGFLKAQGFSDLEKVVCLHNLAKKAIFECDRFSIRAISGFLGFPVEDYSAKSHVEATQKIWHEVSQRIGVLNGLKEVTDWSSQVKRTKSAKPKIEIEQRRNLPDQPGVYQFVNKNGKTLYVGKATNLKTRVASYFTGYKGLEAYKKELMHIACGIEHTICQSPAHAAMLEVQMIQQIDPPYNRALKSRDIQAKFLGRDMNWVEDGLGPFFDHGFLTELQLLQKWQSGTVSWQDCFYSEVDETLERYARKWLELNGNELRNLLALAIWLSKKGFSSTRPEQAPSEPETPFQVVEKIKRYLVRIGNRYLAAKKLIGIKNVQVSWDGFNISLDGQPLESFNKYSQYRVLLAEARSLAKKSDVAVVIERS